MAVPARITIVTLGVADLERSKAFYSALGWELTKSSMPDQIMWFRTAGSYVGLFGYEALAEDANLPMAPPAPYRGVTLAINLESEAAVDEAMSDAAEAGADIIKPAVRADWGGYSGYFADPDGYAWEVAHNPNFPVSQDGSSYIP